MKKFLFILLAILLCAATLASVWGYRHIEKLKQEISSRFDGRRWDLPAVVYARPLELYPGLPLTANQLEEELRLSDYRKEENPGSAGGYSRMENVIQLVSRNFTFPSGTEKSQKVAVHFDDTSVISIQTGTGEPLPYLRLDPARIGSFHPLAHEDRLVLTPPEVPELLKQGLIAVEDRNFPDHHGVSVTSVIRASYANFRAGRIVQGGSTITQQLVKNFFLDRSRTFSRKFQEAVMAILLERHYSKDEILTTYINEVFLGQDGQRAIHGFGLASQFYFRRAINDLSPAQTATLVGMIKGPSAYSPLRHPEQCLKRRQLVLHTMYNEGVIDQSTLDTALQEPLIDAGRPKSGFNRFPAFLDLVRRQLKDEYREEDLLTNGLKIITTLDPLVQLQADRKLAGTITSLETRYGTEKLEGAVIITNRDNGEIQAATGGRAMKKGNFNRALDAKRQVGSLIKPAVYLTAIEKKYTLASPLSDRAVGLKIDGSSWYPKNYDRTEHGRVALYQALARSYNLATARLGLDMGVPEVAGTLQRLGYREQLKPYPSLLLGGVSMTPLEIGQVYQTLASGGFYQPLRSIRAVIGPDGKLLTRYGLEVEQRFEPEHIFLITHALQRVMSEGTGRRLAFAGERGFAGKTGTSDNHRDSWFAGFTADRLAVVWLGRDDNSPTPLTGSTGALQVWGQIMEGLDRSPLIPIEPEAIVWHKIDPLSLKPVSFLNANGTRLPFIQGQEPVRAYRGNASSSKTRKTIEGNLKEVEKEARKLIDAIGDLFQ